MWFDSWPDVSRVLVGATAAYVTLVAVLRVSGKRTLAKLNAFDFVITVALGSTLATIVLSSDVSWAEGAAALIALTGFQFVIALASSRIPAVRSLLTSRPTFLVRDGALLREAMKRQRVAEAEVRQAIRKAGLGDLSEIGAVVLETDGTLSVLPMSSIGGAWALRDVPEERRGSIG